MKALFKLLLKGSLVGAIAMATATGCGDDSSDEGGEGGEGNSGGSTAGTQNTSGSANAGEPSNGGSTSNAGGPSSAGAAGDGGTDSGTGGTGAVGGEGGSATGPNPFGGAPSEGGASYEGPPIAKFCNTLSFDGADTTFRLEVGEGVDMVSFTASTGECVPADGAACREIPTGADIVVSLFDLDDDSAPLDFSPIEIVDNEQWIFYTDLTDGAEPTPIWNGGSLKAGFACEDIIYDDI